MLPSVSLWDQNTSFAHLLGSPQKLWLHFASLITSPHAPFICPLSWKKVIGLEAVLTCFVGYGSENHSSGIPFSYKLLQFPVEVSHWVGVLPQVFRLFPANALQVFLPVGLLETTCKMDPWHIGDMASSWVKAERLGSGGWTTVCSTTLNHVKSPTSLFKRLGSALLICPKGIIPAL